METFRRETSDGQTSDNQTDSVACGVCSTDGRWYGGGRFLDYARNDRGEDRFEERDLRFEGDGDNPEGDFRRSDFRRSDWKKRFEERDLRKEI